MAKRLEVFSAKWLEWRPPSDCHDLGIGELLAFALPEIFATEAAVPTIGANLLGGALGGAGLGAGEAAITGGDPLKGALTGGLTGGVTGGLTGPLSGALDISPVVAGTALGAGSGAIGSELTGSNPLTGALTGGAAGAFTGLGGLSGIANDLGVNPFSSSTGGVAAGVDSGAGAVTAGESGIGGATSGTTSAAAPMGSGGAAIPSSTPSSAAPLSSEGGALATAGGGPGGVNAAPIDNWVMSLSEAPAAGAVATAGGPTTPTDPAPQLDPQYQITPGEDFGGGGDKVGGLGSKVLSYLTNPGVLLGGGLAATSLLMNKGASNVNSIPGATPVNQIASTLTQAGNTELAPLTTGRLPAGAQSSLDLTRSSADAAVRSQFASIGLTGSTMETQALNKNAQQSEAQKWAMINDLVGRGTASLGAAGSFDTTLMNQQIARDKATQDALARFAAALAGAGVKQAA